MRISLREGWDLIKETVDDFFEDGCPMHAAALSYYTAFSLPPLLAILILLAGFVWDPSDVQGAIEAQVRDLIGNAGAAQVRQMLAHKDPNAQCSLNEAIAQSIPSYMKCGNRHFIVSSTSGHASWTIARSSVRIGFANGADFAM